MTNQVTTVEQPIVHPSDLTDLYGVLGVSKGATADEIKAAYRQQAMKYHPDRTKGDEALSEIFRAVQKAYDVLKDDVKRKYYDETGKVKLDEAMIKAEALSVLNQNIIQAIDAIAQSNDPNMEVWKINPLTAVKTKMTEDLRNARTNLGAMKKTMKRYQSMIKRFRNKKNAKFDESPIGNLINQRLENLDESIEKVGNLILIHECALKSVDDYDYDTFTPPEVATPTPSETAAQMQQALMNQWFSNFGPKG